MPVVSFINQYLYLVKALGSNYFFKDIGLNFSTMEIRIKRIYEPYSDHDGFRLLVDRLWPRGIKKEEAHINKWLREISPSTALRKWFNHEAGKQDAFRRRYYEELKSSPAIEELRVYLKENKTITLLFASRDEQYNHAIVLKQFITAHLL